MVEVRKAFDDDPGTLLHMAQFLILEEGSGFASFQDLLQ